MVNERDLFSSSFRQDEDITESEALFSDSTNDQSFVSFGNSAFFGDKSSSDWDWTTDEYETDREQRPFFPATVEQALTRAVQPKRQQPPPQQKQQRQERPRRAKKSSTTSTSNGETPHRGVRSTTGGKIRKTTTTESEVTGTKKRRPKEVTATTERQPRENAGAGPKSRRPGEKREAARPTTLRKKRPATTMRKTTHESSRASPDPSDEIRNYLSGEWKNIRTPEPALSTFNHDSTVYMDTTTEAETDDAMRKLVRRKLRKTTKSKDSPNDGTRSVKKKKNLVRKKKPEVVGPHSDGPRICRKPQGRFGEMQSATDSERPKKRKSGACGVVKKKRTERSNPNTISREEAEFQSATDSELTKKYAGRKTARRQPADAGGWVPTTGKLHKMNTDFRCATDSELSEKRTERRRQAMAGSNLSKSHPIANDNTRPIDDAIHAPHGEVSQTTPTVSRGNLANEFIKPQPLHRGRRMSPEKQFRRRASVGEPRAPRDLSIGPKFGGRVLRTKQRSSGFVGPGHDANAREKSPSPSTKCPKRRSTSKIGHQRSRRNNDTSGFHGEASISDFSASASTFGFEASKSSLGSESLLSNRKLQGSSTLSFEASSCEKIRRDVISQSSRARKQNRGSSSNLRFEASQGSLDCGTSSYQSFPNNLPRTTTSHLNKSYNEEDFRVKLVPLTFLHGRSKLDLDNFSKSTASTTHRSSLGSFGTSTSLTLTPISPSGRHRKPLPSQANIDEDEMSLQLSTLLAKARGRSYGNSEQKSLAEDQGLLVGSANAVSYSERKVLSPFAPEAAKPCMPEKALHDSFVTYSPSSVLSEKTGSRSISSVPFSEQCGINIFEPPVIPASSDEDSEKDFEQESHCESALKSPEPTVHGVLKKKERSFRRRPLAEPKIEDPTPRKKAVKRRSMLWKLLHPLKRKSNFSG